MDWKTYKNNKYGYEIKYPIDWYIQDKEEFGLKISNKQFSAFSGIETPRDGEVFLKIYYFHSAFENGLGVNEYISEDGVELVEDTKYISEGNSFGIIITYRKNDPDVVNLKNEVDQIYSTFKSTNPFESNLPGEALPTLNPTIKASPTSANVNLLQYKLPGGWKIVRDKSEKFEFGYDPEVYGVLSQVENRVDLKYLSNGFYGGSIRILDYDGGSRHKFLLKASGAEDYFDRNDDYFEKDYIYNGRSCLLISGAYVSMSNDSWMMCDIGAGKAVFINAQGGTNTTSIMATVRILK